VEYRGIEIGRVTNISFDYAPERDNQKIPVLVEVDPRLLRALGTASTPEDDILMLGDAVKNGLRATLKTGSLLTGALFVDFDYYTAEKPADLGYKGDFPVVPTMPSGFAQFEVKIASILDKIDALPLDNTLTEITATVAEARDAIKEIEKVAAAAKVTLEDDDFRQLPSDLRRTLGELEKSLSSVGPDGNVQGDLLRTLDELRGAIRAIEAMSDTIKEKPNSLLFGKEESGNPKPKAAGKR
jgi:paraquat-inducible protein B